MILPAWLDLMADRHATPTAYRVYARLVCMPEILWRPQPVKVTNLARQLGSDCKDVRKALRLLIERGYVHESERGPNGVRRVTVALARTE